MAETIKVPGIGDVKKQHVYVGLAVAAGVVGYAWWSRGTAAPADIPAYTEEDVADVVTETPGGAAGGGANDGQDGTEGGWQAPRTDPEWTQQAVDALEGWFEGDAILEALGKYVTRQPLSSLDERIVRAAIGVMGYPPGGRYPIITGTGSTPSALTEPRNLRAVSATTSSVRLDWNDVSGASGYRITRSGSSAVLSSGDSVHTVGGLDAGTSYTFGVYAVDASGKAGPTSSVTARTTAKASTPSTPGPSKPRHRTKRITRRGQTLSDLVAAYNRQYGTEHTWQAIWDYNLRHRSASTARTLRNRGPHKTFIGSSFWFPY